HTRWPRDWSSDVCSSDLAAAPWRGKLLDEERPHFRGGRQCWDRGASPYAVGCRLAGGLQLAALPQVHVAESDLRLGIWRMARLRSEERRVGEGCRWRCGW